MTKKAKQESKKKTFKGSNEPSYTAKDIYVLEGLEPVRKRPGMYIGTTDVAGLHHLIYETVDNSLTYDTPVLIEQDGKVRLEKIGSVVDLAIEFNYSAAAIGKETEILRSGFNIKSLSFNPQTLKLSWTSVSSLIRHKVNSEILELTLQNGRKIEITPYHSLFTFNKGEVASIKGRDLKIGSYVVAPKVFAEPEKYIAQIDLLRELEKLPAEKTRSINLYSVSDLLTGEMKPFVKQYAEAVGSRQNWSNVFNDYRSYDYLPLNCWRLMSVKLKEKFSGCFVGNKRNAEFKLPLNLSVTKELVELLGLYAAEGTAFVGKTNRVVWSFGAHEKELIDYTAGLIKKVFGYSAMSHYAHETATTIQIDSLIVALLFREVFGAGGNSHVKQVPNLIFNLPKSSRERYFIAYLAGDGYPSQIFTKHLIAGTAPAEDERRKFTIVSASKTLIDGLSYLLFAMDKTFSIGEIKNNDNQNRHIKINYKGRVKTARIQSGQSWRLDFYWGAESSYLNRLPVSEAIANISWKRPYSFSINTTGGVTANKITSLLDANRIAVYPETLKFLQSDLGVLKVTKIRTISYSRPWVYDFSVPNGENFVGGSAPIMVHNSIDEAMAGYAKNVRVEFLPNNRVAVTDDGRGIPVEVHPQTKKSTLETVMTTLHAGGKFGGESYKVSGGLHGVGVSVVCALSKWMKTEVLRDGGVYEQEYVRGKPQYKVRKVGKSGTTGTKVTFEPDPEIFKIINFDRKRVLDHLRQQAFLTKGVKIEIIDAREKESYYHAFYFDGGLLSFLKYLNHSEKKLQETPFYINKSHDSVEVEAAFTYNNEIETQELSFANNIYTPDGGMHLTGFRSALTRSLNDYARDNDYIKKAEDNLTGDDVREGLVAIVSVKIREPQFEGQTKARLGNAEARTAVEVVTGEAVKEFLERNTSDARKIVERSLLTAKARKAAKAAKETVLRKGILEGLTLPGKLADCSSRDPAESELFIVEGDSAGGCFSGDTEVALVDGRNVSFKQLVEEHKQGKKNFCYTIDKNGNIAVAPILNPRVTRKNTEVIKIILDNDKEIICTPDHKFMLRDGSYKEVINLTPQNSLMPLYRKYSKIGGKITIDGYEMIFNPAENYWRFTHVLADKYNLKIGAYLESDGDVRHHKDFNKLNNNPNNIVRMPKQKHLLYHTKHLFKTAFRPEILEKLRRIRQSKEYREKISKIMKAPQMRAMLVARAKKQWENEEYKKFMVGKFLDFYKNNPEYREKNNLLLDKIQREYWSNKNNCKIQSRRVTKFFEDHPEIKDWLSGIAKKQWQNSKLLSWRSEKTKEQWTPEFRAKRKITYNKTYLNKALKALHDIYRESGVIDMKKYQAFRKITNDKNLIRPETILDRFFNNDSSQLIEAVKNFNHCIKKIEKLDYLTDVYDLEVSETHNFALARGVFVHNSSKMGRDRRIQAILPLKGKILNVEKSRIDKMLINKEIKSLVVAMGTAIAESFDISKLRYHKIILMTDADVDGAHIRTLLLTLFYRYFPQIIEGGHLYIAQPPLYSIKSGKDIRYAYGDAQKEKIVAEMQKAKATAVNIQRYKGLGEMNPEQLWETTMDPAARMLRQVTVADAEDADRLFDVLMGEEVEPRKRFIEAHALSVKNLDI